MAEKLSFSNRYRIKELARIIRDRTKKIVYNNEKHIFEAISIKESLSLEQTEDKNVLKEKIHDIAGTIHIRLEDIQIVIQALRDRIKKEAGKTLYFFNLRNYSKSTSVEIYRCFEEIFSQIMNHSTEKFSVVSSKKIFIKSKNSFFKSKFFKLQDFKYALNSYVQHVLYKQSMTDESKVGKNVDDRLSCARMLDNLSEDLYSLAKDNILVYQNFRKNILHTFFSKKHISLERKNTNIFEYVPSFEELELDMKALIGENFCDFSFVATLLFKISFTKNKEENWASLINAANSTKTQRFLYKIQLISQHETDLIFHMIAALLVPIKSILGQTYSLKQDLREDIGMLKKKLYSLKQLSYYHWERCILHLFEEWLGDNQELLKLSLLNSLEPKKKQSFISFFRKIFKR